MAQVTSPLYLPYISAAFSAALSSSLVALGSGGGGASAHPRRARHARLGPGDVAVRLVQREARHELRGRELVEPVRPRRLALAVGGEAVRVQVRLVEHPAAWWTEPAGL